MFETLESAIDAAHNKLDVQSEILLSEIPSETSVSERRFLYLFSRYLWEGKSDILEVGSFLGGTTRAIALGMIHNTDRISSTRIHVIDKFRDYYSVERLAELIKTSRISAPRKEVILSSLEGDDGFLGAFWAIHQENAYAELMRVQELDLEAAESGILSGPYSMIHVDGCKSWEATIRLFSSISSMPDYGTTLIFQDYYWYSCFWIPVFLSYLGPHVYKVGDIESTAIFSVRSQLDLDYICNRMPVSPLDIKPRIYEKIFYELCHESEVVNHERGCVVSMIQLAGALAYTGEVDKAIRVIERAEKRYSGSKWHYMLRMARKSPTYNKNGPILLDGSSDPLLD